MTIHSASQIYSALRIAGMSPGQAVTFTAIGLAESGGSSTALNSRGEYSVSVWQINLEAHADLVARMSGIPPSRRTAQMEWLQKLGNAARVVQAISNNGTDISPWTVTHQGRQNSYTNKRGIAEAAARSYGEPAVGYWGGVSGYGDRRGPGKESSQGFSGQARELGPVNFDPRMMAFPVAGLSVDAVGGSGIGHARAGGRKHQGLDIFASQGTPVLSAVSGTLRYAERRSGDGGSSGFGIAVSIVDAAGNHHNYAHLDQTSFSIWQNWQPGMQINAGQIIGYVGKTGNAVGTSPHLHYSINEGRSNLIDPYYFLRDGQAISVDTGSLDFMGLAPGVEQGMAGTFFEDRTNLSVQEALDVARAEFPHLAGYLEIPGISDILVQAVREGRDPGWVQARVQETEWYRTTDENRRLLTALRTQDPAEYESRVKEYALDLFNMASQMGGSLDRMFRGETPESMSQGSKLWQMAEDYMMAGLQGVSLERALAYSIEFTPDIGGDLGSTMNDLDTVARSYFMRMDDETLFGWAQRMLAGETDAENFEGFLENEAKRNFAHDKQIMDQIDQGLSLTEIFSPHINAIATSFETDPELVDLSDPRFQVVFDNIDSEGNRRAMTSVEARRWARTQDESANTISMRNEAAQMSRAITATMGRGSFGGGTL